MYKLLSILFVLICFSSFSYKEQTPTFLTQQDKPAILKVLKNEAPRLPIQSLELISTGGDNMIADVNGEWIFRFPRTEAFIAVFERENLLLNRIRPHITLPIPLYEYVGENIVFVGYRKIQGEELSENLYLSLPVETRQQIAEELALFLNELHHCITPEEALKTGCDFYSPPMNTINEAKIKTLPPQIKNMVLEALDFAKHNPTQPESLVLKHNDLHGDNFALDRTKSMASLIFRMLPSAITPANSPNFLTSTPTLSTALPLPMLN
jgi:aminoglycoside phosphotransferase (APT) family kinase protein